jgi:hypothetical protein
MSLLQESMYRVFLTGSTCGEITVEECFTGSTCGEITVEECFTGSTCREITVEECFTGSTCGEITVEECLFLQDPLVEKLPWRNVSIELPSPSTWRIEPRNTALHVGKILIGGGTEVNTTYDKIRTPVGL